MTILYFKLENQLLSKLNQEIIASGDSNTDQCIFQFSDEWKDYIKTAVFYQNKSNVSYVVLNSEDTCVVPAAAMSSEGYMHVGIFGVHGNEILTSTVESTYIEEGAVSGIEIDLEPSDDIFLAIIAEYQQISEQMAYHNKTADELKASVQQQNERLAELNAFDVLETLQTVREIQTAQTDYGSRITRLEENHFALPHLEINFKEKTLKIEDARLTKSSIADVYFESDSFAEATEAEVDGETFDGYLELRCTYIPEFPLYATIMIRVV